MHFDNSGTNFYVSAFSTDGSPYSRRVKQFELSTAWDISTKGFSTNTIDGGNILEFDIKLSTSGDSVWGTTNSTGSRSYVLTTPFDISTHVIVNAQNSGVTGIEPGSETIALRWVPTGAGNQATPVIEKYSMTNWDASTLALESSVDYTATMPGSLAFHVSDNGLKAYGMLNRLTADFIINEYSFGTAWDISTLTLDSTTTVDTADAAKEDSMDLFVSPTGHKLFVLTSAFTTGGAPTASIAKIYEYDL